MEGGGSHCRSAGGGLNEQGKLLRGGSWAGTGGIRNRSLLPPARMLRIYIEAVSGFRHTSSPGVRNNTSLSRGSPQNDSGRGNGGRKVHSKDRLFKDPGVQLMGQPPLMPSG